MSVNAYIYSIQLKESESYRIYNNHQKSGKMFRWSSSPFHSALNCHVVRRYKLKRDNEKSHHENLMGGDTKDLQFRVLDCRSLCQILRMARSKLSETTSRNGNLRLITLTEMTTFKSPSANLASSALSEMPDIPMVPDLMDDAALMFLLRATSDIFSTNYELYDTTWDTLADGSARATWVCSSDASILTASSRHCS